MINDLSRENIPVYWSREEFIALSKTFTLDNTTKEIFYEKGAFIIPFSGDIYKDTFLSSIIFDYNQTHELENQNLIKNEVYLLMHEVDIDTIKLNEPKIAQHFGQPIRYGWPSYLEIADSGGFLTYEFLLDSEICNTLNNQDFNVVVWPYFPDPGKHWEQFLALGNSKIVNSIREFVRKGGGYVGTCYGAWVGSSGFIGPGSISALIHARCPNLYKIFPRFALSLSDSLVTIHLETFTNFYLSEHRVEQTNHPLFNGLNNTITDFHKSPIFTWLGKNTHALTVFNDIKTLDGESINKKPLRRAIIDRPSWVNSTFGNGKIILFASHPDFINNIRPLEKKLEWAEDPYYGRRIIQNSLFFLPSIGSPDLINYHSYKISFINSIFETTYNLNIDGVSNHIFDDISQRLDELNNDLMIFKSTVANLNGLFEDFLHRTWYLSDNYRYYTYSFWFCEMFQDYINRTKDSIDKLEKIIPMLFKFDETIIEKVENLKNELNQRLDESEVIYLKATNIAENIKEILTSSRASLIQKIKLNKEQRNLLLTFEIEFKYIPQIYFETLKFTRNSWYNYETNVALN